MNASSFFSVTHVNWHWMSSEWDASDSHLISLPLLHVHSSKPSCPGMTLTAAIPFRGQADRFKPGDRVVYVDIIVIYIVLRAILAFLGAWWHGDGRNDFRRDR